MTTITTLLNRIEVNSKEFESFVDDLMIDNNDIPFDSHEVQCKSSYILSKLFVDFLRNASPVRIYISGRDCTKYFCEGRQFSYKSRGM